MFVFRFMSGVLSMTSYNIRISSTQSYVSDDKKGRFNGTFSMLCSLGCIVGRLLSGAMCDVFDIRITIAIFMAMNLLSVFAVFLPMKKHVKEIYNREY